MGLVLKSAFYGALITGILSAIPGIGSYNIICCMWVIAGGLFSVFYYKKHSHEQINTGKGAILGLYTGLMAAVIATIISLLIVVIFGFDTVGLDQAFKDLPIESSIGSVVTGFAIIGYVFMFIIYLILFSIFGTLGGILGAVMFGKQNLKEEYKYKTDYVDKLKQDHSKRQAKSVTIVKKPPLGAKKQVGKKRVGGKLK
tara:strand:+ start:56334 stop:56930 length:597 start_codon:yes stop_codon:yes gene_type:complete